MRTDCLSTHALVQIGVLVPMLGGLALACGPQILLEDTGATDTTTVGPPASTTEASLDATTIGVASTSDTGPGTSVGPGSTGGIIEDPDGGLVFECSTFAQDCPRGEKCVPASGDGDPEWNDTVCSPIVERPDGLGEPCTMERNQFSGVDSCDLGLMCFWVDPMTLQGVCVDLCDGDWDRPACEGPNEICNPSDDGDLPLCLPQCHPLLADCPDGQACVGLRDDVFECVVPKPDAAALGEECGGFLHGCLPGAMCLQAFQVPDCTDFCCTPFCDLGDPAPPCLAGQTCEPWFAPEMVPPGFEQVGLCVLPSP